MKKTLKTGLKSAANIFLALVIALGASGALAAGCFPLLQANATQEENIEALKSAMSAFESYMSTVYSTAQSDREKIPTSDWLESAYQAYTDAQKAYDKFYLGGETDSGGVIEEITKVLAAFTNGTDNSQISYWKPSTATCTTAYDNSYSADQMWNGTFTYGSSTFNIADGMSGVLWTYGVSEGATCYYLMTKGSANSLNGATVNTFFRVGVNFGDIVFLYDGETELACPINFHYKTNNSTNGKYVVASMALTSTTGLELQGYWHGTKKNDSTGKQYQTALSDNNANAAITDYIEGGYRDCMTEISTTATYLSNSIHYVEGDISGSLRQFTGLYFEAYGWNKTSTATYLQNQVGPGKYNGTSDGTTNTDGDGRDNADQWEDNGQSVYVLNYKMLVEAIRSAIPNGKYSEGQLGSLISAISTAEALNPQSYFTSATPGNVYSTVTTVSSLLTEYTNALTAAAPAANQYDTLREALKTYKDIYDGKNAAGEYCPPLWDTFATAYKAAQTAIITAADGSYPTPSDSDSVITALTAAADGLSGHNPEKIPAQEKTCFAAGTKEYYQCQNEGCGKCFSDEACTTEIDEADMEDPWTGHLDLEEQEYTAPTAEKVGYKHHYYCTECGRHYWTEDEAEADTAGEASTPTHLETVLFLLTVDITPQDGETLDTSFIVNLTKTPDDAGGTAATTSGVAQPAEGGSKATVSFIVDSGTYFAAVDSGWSYSYTIEGYNNETNSMVNVGTGETDDEYGQETNPAAVALTAIKESGANARAGSAGKANDFTVIAESD